MKQSDIIDADDRPHHIATRPRIKIPLVIPATPEELARRRALFDEIHRIREEIGPIGMNAVDLIDADFYELDNDTV